MDTPKERMIKKIPEACCVWDKERRKFYLFDDNTNPVFLQGHKSSKKAWKDFETLLKGSNYG